MKKNVRVDIEKGKLVVENREWVTLLIHEGSENTTEIEAVCTELDIPVRYSTIRMSVLTFEKMEVFTIPEGYDKLLSVLKERKLCSEQGYYLGV